MKKNIRPFELQLANSLGICNDPIKKAIANASNQIRKKHGLPELSLGFFEESEHPRGEHGRFASKGSARGSNGRSYERESYYPRERQDGSRFGEFEGRIYDREQVQREMKNYENVKSTAKSRLQDFLESAGILAAGHYLPTAVSEAAKLTGYGLAKSTFISSLIKGVLFGGFQFSPAATLTPGLALLAGIASGALTIYGAYRIGKALISASSYIIAKFATKATIGIGKVVSEPFAEAGRGVYEGATA